ncbi:MAG: DNA polymerase I, partial [Planctomycetes bacterium]|nr:DNA polymerase I [Planctomycetota bacterium]
MSARFFLIDGHAYTYQAFYGGPGLRTLEGRPVGAVYAFALLIQRLREDQRPDYLAVTFDAPGPTFRHERFPAYKANRPAMPEELFSQFEDVDALIAAHGIPSYRIEGYEADDVMGALARQASAAGIETLLVTRDKDLEQLLVDPSIRLFDPKTAEVIGAEEVRARRGFGPDRMVDYLSLVGDSTDNVPGVPGV